MPKLLKWTNVLQTIYLFKRFIQETLALSIGGHVV